MPNRPELINQLPNLGLGLRLRKEYIPQIISNPPPVDWFEIISENYIDSDPDTLKQLDTITERYPVIMHGISLGIGSPWPLDEEYLKKLKQLVDRVDPVWISDHLCWGGADDTQGQLLPLPYSEEMLEHIIPRIQRVQAMLNRRILLENVPSEEIDPKTEIPEPDFIREVAVSSNSLILLDIENLHITQINQSISAIDYLSHLPPERIQQIHLTGATVLCEAEEEAGSNNKDPVWQLFLEALKLFGPTTTMIERLDTIPCLDELVTEVSKARCALGKLFPEYRQA